MSKVLNTFLIGVVTGIAIDNTSPLMMTASAVVGAAVALHPTTSQYVRKAAESAHEKIEKAAQWCGGQQEEEDDGMVVD